MSPVLNVLQVMKIYSSYVDLCEELASLASGTHPITVEETVYMPRLPGGGATASWNITEHTLSLTEERQRAHHSAIQMDKLTSFVENGCTFKP